MDKNPISFVKAESELLKNRSSFIILQNSYVNGALSQTIKFAESAPSFSGESSTESNFEQLENVSARLQINI
jgi:hypothetical protein